MSDVGCQKMTERVIDALRTVYDPELPVNIYDLGLVYTIEVKSAENAKDVDDTKQANGAGEKQDVLIEMTLTTANCPLADMIPGMVYDALRDKIPDLKEIEVRLVWEPPWDPSRMSDDARMILDMF